MLTYIFPGQGSQMKGMGKALFSEFEELTAAADALLGYSVQELCIQDAKQLLSCTQYTQPALYVVNTLSYLKKVKESGCPPDYVAGHSLGEYNALFAAGAFDFITGLKLVQKRGDSEVVNSCSFAELKIPVIANVDARPYRQEAIKQNLIRQITRPVRWTESIRYLQAKGNMEFEEIGHGKVLTGLVQRINRETGAENAKQRKCENGHADFN